MAELGSGTATGMPRSNRTPYSAGFRAETASERARHAALNRFTYSGGFDGYEGRMTCPPAWRRAASQADDPRGKREQWPVRP